MDHIIPWTRHPNDAIENLVPADRRCNGAKSDSLPAIGHIARWAEQLTTRRGDLAALVKSTGWVSDQAHTRAVVRSTYRHLAEGTPLWAAVNRNESFARESWSRLLSDQAESHRAADR